MSERAAAASLRGRGARVALAAMVVLGIAGALYGVAMLALDLGEAPAAPSGADAGSPSDGPGGLRASPPGSAPSCDAASPGADDRCGPDAATSCCAAAAVPGGHFRRVFDGVSCEEEGFEADVSPFALDRFEVTVGRFRRFLAAGGATLEHPPSVGSGAHPASPRSGWQSAWDGELAADAEELERRLDCGPAATWTAAPGEGDARPINCVSWYDAFAFCAWDGGRLPTEAEWNFAAAGGSEERERPWTTERPSSIERAHAVFGEASPFPVGSCSPRGDARWGHADLVGNVWEWTLDATPGEGLLPREGAGPCSTAGLPRPCLDCIGSEGATRVSRGAGFGLPAPAMRGAIRRADAPRERHHVMGVRCARDAASSASASSGSPPGPGASAPTAAAPTVAAPIEITGGVLRGFSRPSLDVETAEILDLAQLAAAAATTAARGGARVLLVRTCGWDASSGELAEALEDRSATLAADGVAIVLLLVEGSRRGQAADVIDLATFARAHGIRYAIATADEGGGVCDGAALLGGDDLHLVGSGPSRDALSPDAPLWGPAL